METVEQIITEMHRKPDAQYLLEWIDRRVADLPSSAIRAAIDAYFVALDEE